VYQFVRVSRQRRRQGAPVEALLASCSLPCASVVPVAPDRGVGSRRFGFEHRLIITRPESVDMSGAAAGAGVRVSNAHHCCTRGPSASLLPACTGEVGGAEQSVARFRSVFTSNQKAFRFTRTETLPSQQESSARGCLAVTRLVLGGRAASRDPMTGGRRKSTM